MQVKLFSTETLAAVFRRKWLAQTEEGTALIAIGFLWGLLVVFGITMFLVALLTASGDFSGWFGVLAFLMLLVPFFSLSLIFRFVHRDFISKVRQVEGRCVNCGYSLHQLSEPRCPECGTAFEPCPASS